MDLRQLLLLLVLECMYNSKSKYCYRNKTREKCLQSVVLSDHITVHVLMVQLLLTLTVTRVSSLSRYDSTPLVTCFNTAWSCGVEVITSALHAEGPQFDPGRDQLVLYH